ncbi:LLM class flavin-dependent oxidoreductase [Kribbella koreensis]|uniref:LLM class flavin-dependent oxidoreductase n=2 Tax=Kribbella TaxID=182639 RepID=A0ABP6VQC8_9ACTN
MTGTDTSSGVRPFRFGVVAPILNGLPAWRDQVRRIADSGYSTVLMPDVQQWQPAPGPALAIAATLAPELRVGTWVYASPLRAASSVAWESHSLSVLTEGRFEMGIGPGRPGMEEELRQSGLPVATPSGRLAQVRDAISALRELDGPDLHTPVVVAARGPKSWALATELADTIICAVPSESRDEAVRMATAARATRDMELALHVAVVGDERSAFMAGPDTDIAALRAKDSLLVLPADPKAAVEELLRRREEGGFSYIVIGANAAEVLAPAVAELTGR